MTTQNPRNAYNYVASGQHTPLYNAIMPTYFLGTVALFDEMQATAYQYWESEFIILIFTQVSG
jgi:hypothetical protein